MRNYKLLAIMSFAIPISGCVSSLDKHAYETTPVQVKTDQGIVVCQLYRHDRVIWDEAIDIPRSMTIQQADRICVNEGHRRLVK